jgi:serine/threonine protein kinase
MAAGELWNVGIILYTFYQGEFPFKGETDEQIIDLIVNRPNNWMPLWREGTSEQMKNFIMMCLEADPFKRGDKLQYINHPYIM